MSVSQRGSLVRPAIATGMLIFAWHGGAQQSSRASIGLSGRWEFRLDPDDVGVKERWFLAEPGFGDSIAVPGCWQALGFGKQSGILRHHYVGKAWYKRTVQVPREWRDKIVRLKIGGAIRFTDLYVNGRHIGRRESLNAPFDFDITDAVEPGQKNVFALRVENSSTGVNGSPDVQEPTQPTGTLNYVANWGGIYGHVSLEATERTWIESVYVRSEVAKRIERFRIHVETRETETQPAHVVVAVPGATSNVEVIPGRSSEVEVTIPGARLWSPDDPYLYEATIVLTRGGREIDRTAVRFGMREVTARGNRLLLNGKPLYLRGYGDDNVEVLSGVPPASKDTYLQRLKLAKSFGFNGVRFHSMTPVREYLEAADEVGMLVMGELPVAYTQYLLPHKEFLRQEMKDLLLAYRNHPSLLSLALGNEFNLTWIKDPARTQEFLETVADFYQLAKSIDPARLILSNDGYPVRPSDMFSLARGAAEDIPTLRHEFGGYYCSLPDVSLINKFTGVLLPTWLKEKKRWVDANGLMDVYPTYVRNSQRLQQLGRKFQIERIRRDSRLSGYHYWLIVDFPGGTGEGDSWEEGWFDYFWRPKVPAEEGRELNATVLPMIATDVGDRSVWSDSRKPVRVFVSNFGDQDIRGGILTWRLRSGNNELASSQVRDINVSMGEVGSVAELALTGLPQNEARKIEFAIELNAGGRVQSNHWSFWSFPRDGPLKHSETPVFSAIKSANLQRVYPFLEQNAGVIDPAALLITSSLSSQAVDHLALGGRVLLLADQSQFGRPGESMFFAAAGGAMGTIVRDHPSLAGFPHENFCDLQFYNLLNGASSFALDRFPRELEPVVSAVRTTSSFLSRQKDLTRAGYLFEVKAGPGRLLATTFQIRANFDDAYPEVIFLFDRLLRYALSPEFAPQVELTENQLASLIR